MWHYIVKRILQSVVVLAALSYFIFYIMTLMPGDPVEMLITSNPHITAADVERLRELYQLDTPVHVRYQNWIKRAIKGDLGYSRTYKVPVQDLIAPRLLNTFLLSAAALTLALLIGLTVGTISGLRPGSKIDYMANLFTFVGISVPAFWLGILLIIIFAVWLGVLPAGGTNTVGGSETHSGFEMIMDRARYLVLPTISLAVMEIGYFSRFTRSAVAEAMRNDYIRTARSKGLSKNRITIHHGLRNALIPIITVLTLSLSGLFNGAIITEIVFAYQGVGKLVYDAIMGNDFNVAMVAFMISVAMVLGMNLLGDILYAVVDPRIDYQ